MTPRPPSGQPIPEHATNVFSGILFDVYQWQQELFDGSTTTFEKLRRRDSAVVVPILPDGRFLVVEDTQPGRMPVLTFPGGQSDDGEDPKDAALRELYEETGYRSDNVVLWKALQPASKIDWSIFIFIARGVYKDKDPEEQAGERIESSLITFEELLLLPDKPNFVVPEIVPELIHARYDEKKRNELKKMLYG